MRAQVLLAGLGYYDGEQDGAFTDPTREAVRRFQSDQGLAQSGDLDDATLDALERADRRAHPPGDYPLPSKSERLV